MLRIFYTQDDFWGFLYTQSPAQERFTNVMKFSPDLAFRVSDSLERFGYCIFGTQELERLFAHHDKDDKGRRHLLEEFASFCGATVETTPHLKSARFTRAT